MPTYVNSTGSVIIAQGVRCEANANTTSNIFITSLPAGLTQLSVTPIFDEALQTATVTSSSTVTLTSTITQNYVVKIYCAVGSVALQLNDTSAASITLGVGDSYSIYCSERIVDNLIFTISSGTAYVNVLKG